MVEAYLVHSRLTLASEDRRCAELGRPQNDGVEGSYEELKRTHRQWCWYDVEIFLVQDFKIRGVLITTRAWQDELCAMCIYDMKGN